MVGSGAGFSITSSLKRSPTSSEATFTSRAISSIILYCTRLTTDLYAALRASLTMKPKTTVRHTFSTTLIGLYSKKYMMTYEM